jgi:putative ABC transport system permease protein
VAFRLPWRTARHRARELDDELAHHLACRAAVLEAQGVPTADARARALAEFGDLDATRAYCLRQDAALDRRFRWSDRVHTLAQEIRIAVRALARRPAIAGTVVATLALGVSGTTALWTVVHQMLLHPFDVRDAQRVVALWQGNAQSQMNLYPRRSVVQMWRSEATSFEAIEEVAFGRATARADQGAEQLGTAAISETFLDFLGQTPLVGRGFVRDDRVAGAPPVAALGYGFWQRRYGGERVAVGQVLRLDTIAYTIVGVLPRDLPHVPGSPDGPDVWLPASLEPAGAQAFAVGRLKPGVSMAQAQAELRLIDGRHAESDPNVGNWRATLDRAGNLGPSNTRMLLMLLSSAGLVLLLCCANVSHLLFAWSTTRRREAAVRSALGGSAGRLTWQALLEVMLLGGAGGLAGLLAARPLLRLLIRFRPPGLALDRVHLDGTALAVSVTLGVGAALLAGLVPALRLRRVPPGVLLRGSGRGSSGVRTGILRQALVAFEVAASVFILVAAGLIGRSLWRMRHADVGYAPDGLVTASWELPMWRFTSAAAREDFHDRLLRAVRAEPAFTAATYASALPPHTDVSFGALAIEGREFADGEAPAFFASQHVLPDYFAVMRVPILAGPAFDARAQAGDEPTVIINRTFAARYWPSGDAVGQRISIAGGDWNRIVGVVEDVPLLGLGEERGALQIYRPLNLSADYMTLAIRTALPLKTATERVRSLVAATDPVVPITRIRTARDLLDDSMKRQTFSGVVFAGFGVVALLLYAGGLFGVLSFAVSQRTKEIGIRVALGADPGRVRGLVVRQALASSVAGALAGAVGAWIGAGLLRSLLYEVPERDLPTFAAVLAVTIVATAWASYGPARGATRLDLMTAICEE